MAPRRGAPDAHQVLVCFSPVAVVTFAKAHVHPPEPTVNLGDTSFLDATGDWPKTGVGALRLQQRVVLDFELPVGEHSAESMLNLSGHAYTIHPYYAVTVFRGKRFETSWRVYYLWNGTNSDPGLETGLHSSQAGQAIHFNATTAARMGAHFWLGANGYYLKQVTSPKVNGVGVANSPEQVGTLGPGVVWKYRSWFFYANAYREFAAENRLDGRKIVLRAQWVVKAKGQ